VQTGVDAVSLSDMASQSGPCDHVRHMVKRLTAVAAILLVVVIALVIALVVSAHRRRAESAVLGGGAFRLKVSDPEYTAMLDGKKAVEARLDAPPFDRLEPGDPVVVVRARAQGDTSEYPGGRYKYDAEVVRVDKYPSLDALLKAEGAGKVYPGKSAAEAAERFEAYLPNGRSASDPVLAIEVRPAGGAGGHKKAPAAKKLAAGAAHPKKKAGDTPFDYGYGGLGEE